MQKLLLIIFIELVCFSKSNAQSNIDSASFYFNQNEYNKAIIFSSKRGDYISLCNMGNHLFESGIFEKSIVFLLKANEVGKNAISLEQKLANYQLIGVCYFQLNDFKNAISFLSNAYELSNPPLSDAEGIALLNVIGICYESTNDFESAINSYTKALKLNRSYSDEYFKALGFLSNLLRQKDDFFTAEEQSKDFLNQAKKYKGENSNAYLAALNNLCQLYINTDIYDLANKYCSELVELNKRKFGEISLEYLVANSIFVELFYRQGRLIEAQNLLLEIIDKYNKFYNKEFRSIALKYNQLASIQESELKFDSSINTFLKGIEIIRNNSGESDEVYALLVGNLAGVFLKTKDYKNAEFYLKKAIEIKTELNSIDIDILYANLASLYQEMNRCGEAEEYFLKSIKLQKNKLSDSYKEKILGLALVYNCLKNKPRECENLLIYSNILKEKIKKNNLFMSDLDIQMYIRKNIKFSFYSHSSFSFLDDNPTDYFDLNKAKFDELLLLKNISLHKFQNIKNSIARTNNIELKNSYIKFQNNKKQISKLDEISENKRLEFYNNLISETEKLEKYLVQESNKFLTAKKSLSINWEDLRKALKPNEVALEIVNYAYVTRENNLKDTSDNIYRYAAFIVTSNSKFPEFIPLAKEKKIESLIYKKNPLQFKINLDEQYLTTSANGSFIRALLKKLEGITTIYLSPSGLGHQINFAALPVSATQTFGEKYQVHILNSPAEIIDYKPTSINKKDNIELLLYGGIDYNKSNGIAAKETPEKDTSSFKEIVELATRSGIASFGYLGGTNKEVEQIKAKGIQNGFATSIIKERDATEESIKKLDGKTSPYILHLATHGFFFPDPKQEATNDLLLQQGNSKVYKASDNPMLRSGLLLAGANNFWAKPNNNSNIEDGILYANEISNLDLSACQLVVLSACETGLGEINGSEGVFGLQRAFKMAGVKNIIMSLWKVPDAQTAELFDIFYSECFSGKTIHQALQIAQSKMKAKYSPYYWAGFVLLE